MEPQSLTASQIDAYKRDGFVLVKGAFSRREMDNLTNEGHQLLARLPDNEREAAWAAAKDILPEASLHHCHDVQFHSAAFGRLLFDERWLLPAPKSWELPTSNFTTTSSL